MNGNEISMAVFHVGMRRTALKTLADLADGFSRQNGGQPGNNDRIQCAAGA